MIISRGQTGRSAPGTRQGVAPGVDFGQADVNAWTNIAQIAAGSFHTVAVDRDGEDRLGAVPDRFRGRGHSQQLGFFMARVVLKMDSLYTEYM